MRYLLLILFMLPGTIFPESAEASTHEKNIDSHLYLMIGFVIYVLVALQILRLEASNTISKFTAVSFITYITIPLIAAFIIFMF